MPSDFISRKLAQTIFHAFDFAKYIAKPLNTYAVINLRAVDAEDADQVMQVVRNKCRVWMKGRQRKAGEPEDPPYYVCSFECPDGENVHVNWVLHVPKAFQREFRKKLPGWVRKAQSAVPGPYDIDVQDVDPRTDKRLAKYVLKGTDPAYREHFHLDEFTEPQGPIHGRRASASMSLNKSARKVAGFVAKRHRNLWKKSPWAQPILAKPAPSVPEYFMHLVASAYPEGHSTQP